MEVSPKSGLQTLAVATSIFKQNGSSHETRYSINVRPLPFQEQYLDPSSQRIPRAPKGSELAFVDLRDRDPKERQVSKVDSREGPSPSYDSENFPKPHPFSAEIPPFNPMNVKDLKAVRKALANKDTTVPGESANKGNREATKIRSDIGGQASRQASLEREPKVRYFDHTPTAHPAIELSVIDQKWGRLFDEGRPTERLGQFLRGLANHIVSLAK